MEAASSVATWPIKSLTVPMVPGPGRADSSSFCVVAKEASVVAPSPLLRAGRGRADAGGTRANSRRCKAMGLTSCRLAHERGPNPARHLGAEEDVPGAHGIVAGFENGFVAS